PNAEVAAKANPRLITIAASALLFISPRFHTLNLWVAFLATAPYITVCIATKCATIVPAAGLQIGYTSILAPEKTNPGFLIFVIKWRGGLA
ncbi:MAG: hypothetical protein ACYCPX_12900, partial [Acidiferrobacteraceae bacterium]